jgi:hypothetical protein
MALLTIICTFLTPILICLLVAFHKSYNKRIDKLEVEITAKNKELIVLQEITGKVRWVYPTSHFGSDIGLRTVLTTLSQVGNSSIYTPNDRKMNMEEWNVWLKKFDHCELHHGETSYSAKAAIRKLVEEKFLEIEKEIFLMRREGEKSSLRKKLALAERELENLR